MGAYNPDEFVMWLAELMKRAVLEENIDDFAVNVVQASRKQL